MAHQVEGTQAPIAPIPNNREGSPWAIALRRLLGDRLTMVAIGLIATLTLVAILGYIISPDPSPNANSQHLELATRSPGFRATFLRLPPPQPVYRVPIYVRLTKGRPNPYREIPILSAHISLPYIEVYHFTDPEDSLTIESRIPIHEVFFPQHHSDSIRFANGSVLIVCSINPIRLSVAELDERLNKEHIVTRRFWLGTDRFGRDMLSRLILGGSISLSVGFIAVAISLIIGITLGATAGYFRGWYDDLVMWLINVVWSIPTLLMVIALTMVLGKGFWQIFVAVGLTMWVEVARVVRGQVLSLREKEFVEAARVMGFGSGRIIFNHILPNVLGPVIIISAGNFATAILLEAGLSFLGIGVQPPTPSWGTMIRDHYGYIIMDKAFLAILPGVCIMLLVLGFIVLGNGLRDALDPKKG